MIMSRTQKKLTKLIQSLLLVVGLVHLMALAQTPEKITIKSHTPQDYADIFSGRYKQAPVEITGFLSFPVGQGKFPAVVIVPGSGGVSTVDAGRCCQTAKPSWHSHAHLG
jgi:hypothetical protein